jgi:predicted transcriptional regulator
MQNFAQKLLLHRIKRRIKMQAMKRVFPRHIRQLRAERELKNLTLAEVSHRARLGYSETSRILNGRLVDGEKLNRVRRAIRTAPEPREVAVA